MPTSLDAGRLAALEYPQLVSFPAPRLVEIPHADPEVILVHNRQTHHVSILPCA